VYCAYLLYTVYIVWIYNKYKQDPKNNIVRKYTIYTYCPEVLPSDIQHIQTGHIAYIIQYILYCVFTVYIVWIHNKHK
jgi:hypothetical protein